MCVFIEGEAKVTALYERDPLGTGVDLQSSKYISQSRMSAAGRKQHIYVGSCLHINSKDQILVYSLKFRHCFS